jgi:DNA-binding transcriptional regulator YiaG
MTKTKDDFGLRLRVLRERLQLTQQGMAESLGVSFATVNRWENGWTAPSKLAIRQIDLLCSEHSIEPVTYSKRSAK